MADLKRILHVDDDEDIRIIANMALEMVGGFVVLQCDSGAEAVEKGAAFAPDLFLLDYMMPGMNGEETLLALRKIPGLSRVPAVFMTARVQADVSEALLKRGALDVITKPFDPMKLGAQLHEIWSKRGRKSLPWVEDSPGEFAPLPN